MIQIRISINLIIVKSSNWIDMIMGYPTEKCLNIGHIYETIWEYGQQLYNCTTNIGSLKVKLDTFKHAVLVPN